MSRRFYFAAAALLAALLTLAMPASANNYTLIDLGTLPGAYSSYAVSINEAGQVLGNSGSYAFLYDDGVMTNLGTLPGGTFSHVGSMNEAGQVIGVADTLVNGSLQEHAFLYSDGVMTDLGTLPGDTISVPTAINEAGQVIGVSGTFQDGWNQGRAFLYSGGDVTALTLPGDAESYPVAINDAGQVMGRSGAPTWAHSGRGFLYSGGVLTDLTLPGDAASNVTDMNEAGQVVGISYSLDNGITSQWDHHSFFYSAGVLTDLSFPGDVPPLPPGGVRFSYATSINEAGQVSGFEVWGGPFIYSGGVKTYIGTPGPGVYGSTITEAGQLAAGGNNDAYPESIDYQGPIAWHYADGEWTELTLPGGFMSWAVGINETGQMVGNSMTNLGFGGEHAVLVRIANTLPGDDVPVQPSSTVGLVFDSIVAQGETTVAPTTAGEAPPLPANFQLSGAVFYEVRTTATFSGVIQLSFQYDPAQFPNEAAIRLLHYENGAWQDVTTSVDTANNVIHGQTTSLSPFAIAPLAQLPVSWSGVLQPVNANGSSIFKLGRTVPVKFRLTGESAAITNLAARLYLAKLSNGIAGTEIEAESTSAADRGNTFRYTGGEYQFNLGTSALSEGTWRMRIDLGDGVLHTVDFSLRK